MNCEVIISRLRETIKNKQYVCKRTLKLLFLFFFLQTEISFSFAQTWTLYNTSNSGLPENYLRDIKIDNKGNKWFGTLGSGLVKYNDTSWTVYNTSNSGLSSDYVNSIAFDSNGNKWLGTGEGSIGGLAKFDDTNWTIYNTSNSGLPYNNIVEVVIDGFDNKWISCKGTSPGTPVSLMKFDGVSWTEVYWELNNNYARNMYIANDTVLWYALTEFPAGLVYRNCILGSTGFYDNTNSPMNYPGGLVVENNGTEWIVALNGLYKHYNSIWTNYNTTNSNIPNNFIFDIALDHYGNKWIATYDSSLVKFDNTIWTVYTKNITGVPRYISKIAIDDNKGEIWLYIIGSGVMKATGLITDTQYVQPINKFNIFPNPSNGVFTLNYGALEPAIYIYNILGKLVYKKDKAVLGSMVIDISTYAKGIYFVKVQSEGAVYTEKVVVE